MLIAWTSVSEQAQANAIASEAVVQRLAVCAQVEGPVSSHYQWKGKFELAKEFRIMFKFLPDKAKALEALVLSRHTYDTPEWVVVEASHVSEKYLSWAQSEATNRPL